MSIQHFYLQVITVDIIAINSALPLFALSLGRLLLTYKSHNFFTSILSNKVGISRLYRSDFIVVILGLGTRVQVTASAGPL